MKQQALSKINKNKTDVNPKKANFISRAKSAVFIVLYFLIIIALAIFCDPQCRLAPAFLSNKWWPFIFYVLIFCATIWLNILIAIEINNCFIQYKKIKNNIILSLMLIFFEIFTIWIFPAFGYGFVNIDLFTWQIIFVSCLGLSTLLIFLFTIIYFRLNSIRVTKTILLGALLIVLIHLTYIAGNYLIITKSWFVPVVLTIIPTINDSFAYFGGLIWGKHKMAPKLSPKKTWEGFSVGIIATLCVSIGIIIALYYTNNPSTNKNYSFIGSFMCWQWLNVNSLVPFLNDKQHLYWLITVCSSCLVIALVAVLGDLLFSYFKRVNQIKDYSNFIPGHGGIIDRLDSFILTIVVYFLISIILCLCFNKFSTDSFLLSLFKFA